MFNFLRNLFGTKKEKVKKPHSPFYEEGEKDLDVNEIFKTMRPHLESFAVESISTVLQSKLIGEFVGGKV